MANSVVKFKNREYKVDAIKWTGGEENAAPIIDFIKACGSNANWREAKTYRNIDWPECIFVKTPSGFETLTPGQWVVNDRWEGLMLLNEDQFKERYTSI